MTRVYIQQTRCGYPGSALDASYIGSVDNSPEEVAAALKKVKGVVSVEIYGDEVVCWKNVNR